MLLSGIEFTELGIGRVSIRELGVGCSRAGGQGDVAIELRPNQKLDLSIIFYIAFIVQRTRSDQMFKKPNRTLDEVARGIGMGCPMPRLTQFDRDRSFAIL